MTYKKLGCLLIGIVIFSVATYALAIIYLTWPISDLSVSNSGAFGDSFGILSSLFSGLAFAGLIITIIMQKEELSLQRKDLSLTRKELKGQKEEFALQNQTLKIQKFENTFFQLLSIHNQNVESLTYRSRPESIERKGRECFKGFLNDLGLDKKITVDNGKGVQKVETIENYDINYKYIAPHIEHYQKTLYQILSFIDRSDDITNKKLYSNIIRAQLSLKEIELLFFHCLGEYGKKKFKVLVEKYEFFEHLKLNDLVVGCMSFYDKRAFGKNAALLNIYFHNT